MKKVIASAGLLALGAVGVHDAHADWAAGADKPWSVSGTLRGFYDDNINTLPNNDPNKVGSFGFEASPSFHTSLSSGPTTFTASYTYGVSYFSERTPNHFDQSHDLELFMNHSFNERYALDVEESFIDSQEPDVIEGGAIARANGDNFRNVIGFHFTDQATELLNLVFGYSNTFYDYTGDQSDFPPGSPTYGTLLDRFEHLVILNARYQVAEETTAVLGYNFGAVQYISGGAIDGFGSPSISRNNFSHYFYAGVDHNFRSDLSLSARAGVQYVDYYDEDKSLAPAGNAPSAWSPYASLSVNYTYMDGGIFTLGFIHTKNQTDVTSQGGGVPAGLTQDQESSTVTGTITQTLTPLSPDLTATLTAQYQNSAYNGGAAGGGNLADNLYSFGANLNYQFTHYISGEVGYNYDLVSSQIVGRGYDRNRVYIGVTASY
jgi:Putative beta-barrel porin 2